MSLPVSLVVVNYNGAQFLPECLDSIRRQSREPDEVIVVDNASTDESLEVLRAYPEVRVLPQEENIGFAAGCNRGIAEARGDLIGILNNDLSLDPNWLESLLNTVTDGWGFWASLILRAGEQGVVDSAGDGMAVIGAAFKIGHGGPAKDYQEPREVFGPCAAAALYRRELLDAIKGFDEDFFLIYEDADLNFRARLLGYRCLFVPEARAYHHVNSSIGSFSHHYVFFGQRNSEYVFWKNTPPSLLLLYLPERMLFNLIAFLYFLTKGRGTAYVSAKWNALNNLRELVEKRRQIQRNRRLTVRQIRKLLYRNWLRYRWKPLRRK